MVLQVCFHLHNIELGPRGFYMLFSDQGGVQRSCQGTSREVWDSSCCPRLEEEAGERD